MLKYSRMKQVATTRDPEGSVQRVEAHATPLELALEDFNGGLIWHSFFRKPTIVVG